MPDPTPHGPDLDTAPDALRRAFGLLADWVADGTLPAAAAIVARGGRIAGEVYLGLAHPAGRPADADTVWGLASITKPVTATAVLLLVERGVVALDEPVHTLLPEFMDAPATPFDRRAVTLRHLLAHCSGLPGFPPDNLALRRAHRPLADFARAMLRQPLLFAPGALHYYSNAGITALAEVVGRAAAGTLRQSVAEPAIDHYHPFVEEAILAPLGMTSSALRPPEAWADRFAWVRDTGQEGEDWELANTAYYRSLGIPWGGLFSRPRDLIRFVDCFLPAAGGRLRIGNAVPGPQIVSPATARAMTTIQFAPPDAPADLAPALRDGSPPEVIRPQVEWGLGWQVKGAKRAHDSGDLTSPQTFCHSGATGTYAWADPQADLACVLLTNRAHRSGWHTDQHRLARFNNAVRAAAT